LFPLNPLLILAQALLFSRCKGLGAKERGGKKRAQDQRRQA
jgi:hypothetical protein